MGIQIIKMPDIGEGIAEVELVAWHVKVGDVVAEDQILADVMTDKATVEIPSSVSGTVLALGGVVGQVMAVGSEVIRIETAATQSEPPAVPRQVVAPPVAAAVESPVTAATEPAPLAPQLPPASAEPPTVATELAKTQSEALANGRPIAAPAVRRRASDLGIDLSQVEGTGPSGRISHADLDAYNRHQVPSPASTTTRPATPRAAMSPPSSENTDNQGDVTIPVIGLRRKIAQKMQEAKRHIPHFTYVEEMDVTELEALRAQLNAEHGKTRGRLTLLPFLIRAMVLAIRAHPEVNARYDDEAAVITRFASVHLGLATQTAGGLMVPVIRDVQNLDLWACAAEVQRLAEAARNGRATRDELTGSTITLTSLGALGGIVSTPVINHPEVAIVGTNRIVERPAILAGTVVARKMMNLSSSFDHRVVDGMNAAEFIQRVRRLLECPALLFVP
jgi:2-oxoisovalerate dehydrogenase E2 component (dihydrolipoyl transacylase)